MYDRRIPHGACETAAKLSEGEMVTNGGLEETSLPDIGKLRSNSAGQDLERCPLKIEMQLQFTNKVGASIDEERT